MNSGPSNWPFGGLTPLKYQAILADPAWRFVLRSAAGEGKSPQRHYRTLTIAEIKALPVSQLAAGDCLLFLWATAPMIRLAFEVMDTWGFRFVTMGGWGKQSRTGRKWNMGTGYVMRSCLEPFIIGAIGKPRYRSKSQRNFIPAPVREHSRKPDQCYDLIEALIPTGPYAEIFSRTDRPGWESWGDQTGTFRSEKPSEISMARQN